MNNDSVLNSYTVAFLKLVGFVSEISTALSDVIHFCCAQMMMINYLFSPLISPPAQSQARGPNLTNYNLHQLKKSGNMTGCNHCQSQHKRFEYSFADKT